MNIIVASHTGTIVCRPDTTLEREARDLYTPDFVDGWLFSPVLFARISKAGKCVGEKFAERYYDCTGYGMLLYPAGIIMHEGGQPAIKPDIAWASCLDHTSILPQTMFGLNELDSKAFSLHCDEDEIFTSNTREDEIRALIEKNLCESSRYVSLRIGDLLAIELSAPEALNAKSPRICGTLGDSEIFRFKIM